MQVKDSNRDRRSIIVLAVVCFVLQVMLAPYVGMGNGRINFALVFCGVYALSTGGRAAVGASFAAGLLFDLLSTSPVGLMAALLTVFSFALGAEERNRFADGFVASLSAFGVGALLVTLAYHLAMTLLGEGASVVDLLFLRTLPTFALTFVAFLPFAYQQVRASSKGRGLGVGGRQQGLGGSHYDVRNL